MITRTKLLASALALSLIGATAGCGIEEPKTERWATTANTNVPIDWDKVNEAYKQAEGPEDLERRINEIYEGDEVISVAVHDLDDKQQVVTGFFDKDKDGKVSEPEKIFEIKRTISGEGQAQVQTHGYGPHYGYYHSPVFDIMTGMLLGSMLSSAFAPRYVPVYTQPYTTPPGRADNLRTQRTSYRAQHPERFSRASQTGRRYGGGGTPTRSSPPRSRGGFRFGIKRGARPRPVRLTA